jgi:hypothetical protein
VEYLLAKQRIAREEARAWAPTLPQAPGQARPALPSASAAWNHLGPTNAAYTVYAPPTSVDGTPVPNVDSGRLSLQGILTHPSNAQIVYVATSGGGLWKATNADLNASGDWNWTSMTDALPHASATGNVPIGAAAMCVADPQTILIGLGDFVDATGVGTYKSTDGAATWTELGPCGGTTRIMSLYMPDASTILVGGNAGMWRSTNGGASFTNLSLGGSTTGSIWSIQPVGASTLKLAATRQIGTVPTFWYSSDGGATWTQASLDAAATAAVGGRATLRGSAGSATVLYAMAENSARNAMAQGVLKSSDAGHTWTFLPAPTAAGGLFQAENEGSDGGQSWYNQGIAVDPLDPNHVFLASNLALFRSLDGGATWKQLTNWATTNYVYAHADWHTSAWSQTGPLTLFMGNDGGLCVIRDPLRASPPYNANAFAWIASDVSFVDNRRNRGLGSHLLYHLGSTQATTPADSPYRISIGLQDNSSRIRVDEGAGLQNSSTWNDTSGTGDGFGTIIHALDGNKIMVSSYNTSVRKSVNGGTSWSSIGGATDAAGAPFYTRVVPGQADATGNTAYTATNKILWKTADWGATSWAPVPMNGFTGNNIRNINTSKTNANALALVSNGGLVWTTYNGGTTWSSGGGDITSGSFNLSYVWFDTNNDQTIYASSVTLSTAVHHLWKSSNGGASWVPIDGAPSPAGNGFPYGIPVHVIKNDPSDSQHLLAGTDFGVYHSTDGGSTWSRYGAGLPMVATRDLYIAPDGSFVRAGTYGRGVWEIQSTGGSPVSIAPTSVPQGTAWTPYSQTLTASGGVAPYTFTVSSGALPTGLSLSSGGALAGTPTAAGATSFTITATDSTTPTALTGNRPYALTIVGPSIALSPASLPNGNQGTAYSQTLTASGGTSPYAFAVLSGALPTGLTLNSSTGALGGTPTATGTWVFSVQATDAHAFTGSRSYSVQIAAPALALSPASLAAASRTIPYSQAFSVAGGVAPYAFTLSSGTLPPGLTFSGAGLLSGTPSANGSYSFTLKATDSTSPTALAATLALVLQVADPVISITPQTLFSGLRDQPYAQPLAAAGGTAPYAFSLVSGSLPPGLALAADGVVSGTPTSGGHFTFAAQAVDANGFSGTQTITLDVAFPPLDLGPITLPAGQVYQAFAQTITASNGIPPYRFRVITGALPESFTLTTDGQLTGAPLQTGTSTFAIQADDAVGASGFRIYTILVQPPILALTPDSLPSVTLGTAYLQDLTVAGGRAPYTFALAAGSLPPGLVLSASGRISGTPTVKGTASFTVRATDVKGFTGTQAYQILVGDQPPAITVQPLGQSVLVGAPVSFSVTATGTPPLVFQWQRNGTAIPGATASVYSIPATVPADEGAVFTVSVANSVTTVNSSAAVLRVGPVTVSRSLVEAGLLPSRTATFSAVVTGAVNPAVTWSASGGTVTPSGSSAGFQASAAGVYTLTATSVADPSRSATITVRVHGADYTTPGRVTGADALKLIGKMGASDPAIDLNGDGVVDAVDLDLLLTLLGW